jgi:hypothetical protein
VLAAFILTAEVSGVVPLISKRIGLKIESLEDFFDLNEYFELTAPTLIPIVLSNLVNLLQFFSEKFGTTRSELFFEKQLKARRSCMQFINFNPNIAAET